MTRILRLTAAYAFFAAIATAANLGAQWGVLRVWRLAMGPRDAFALIVAMACGTALGLAIKYGLDKRFIFRDRSTGARVHARKFGLYSAMGLVTTAIFWTSELVANRIDPTGSLIYLGGAIGLTVGYLVKYQLDRRFVFQVAR